ncbi:MAG: type VI secretion protein [Parvularcula sp.]|nr:type VI secretion protein [Parvularcula sp.]
MWTKGGRDPRSGMSESALETANAYAMPRVAESNGDRLTGFLGATVLLMLGLFVFNQLSKGREAASIDAMMAETRAQLSLAQSQAEEARREAQQAQAQARRAEQRAAVNARTPSRRTVVQTDNASPAQANLRSPALVVDNSRAGDGGGGEAGDPSGAVANAVSGLTASEAFAQRVGGAGPETVRATRIEDMSRVVPQGTIVSGVLETAINSDLPGFARAIVSENIRSLDNRTVLIPRGSRLIGQYRSGLAIGESRAFVIWTRLLTPEGVSIELASPATDTLGRAGLDGKVNRHFFQRFGSAILLSVIDVGANALIYDNNSSIVIGSTSEAQAVAAQALSQQMNIPPTITVKQGTEIRIFLARDLYFPSPAETGGLRP